MLRRADCMKILYIAQELCAAQVAARALSRIAPNVRLSWASSPEAAIGWIRDNRDAQAVIAETGREDPAFDALLEQVRGIGVTTPIAAVAPEHLDALSAALEANLEVLATEERQRVLQDQAERDAVLARTNRVCIGLQEQLFELEAALHAAGDRQAAQAAATEQLVRREAELSAAVAEETALRGSAEQRLAAAQFAREDDSRMHAAEVTSLTTRLGEREALHEVSLARINRICAGLQQRSLELEAAMHGADERHGSDTAAIEQLIVREAEVHAALEDARRRWQSEVAALTVRLQQRETELSVALADALAGRAEVENRLADTAAAHQRAEQRSAAEPADAARKIAAFEARLSEEAGARAALEERLAAAAATHEQARSAWQSDISAAAALHAVVERQLEAGGRDNARLQADADSLRRQLDVMRMRADTLRRHAAQVPVLQVQLERSQKENRRQFERAPYGLCECGRDGSITRVNHSLAGLLGYRTARELQDVDVAGTVFESATDLRWLLDRALQTGRVETLATTLTTRDVRRLSVRLHAHSQDGWVTIAVEDLTALHEAEQRLREAQRLEAVGRVASEVATTCDTLLRDVSQGGRQWLAGLEDDAPLRQQGELLLGDVTRASGLLHQFVVYGHQQISNAGSVNLARALREMAPILKRVLGDDIALLLPKATGRLDVDVDTERVGRILVNVANYARERMPHGGRVKIRLATVTVDHEFVVSHPKVRPGGHVLITIEEIKGPVWPPLPIHLPIGRSAHHDVTPTPSDRPGIDLGPLAALIGEVGGHLWMSAEPAGNMTLRVHLPKRTEDESLQPVAAVAGRARQFTRWFRH